MERQSACSGSDGSSTNGQKWEKNSYKDLLQYLNFLKQWTAVVQTPIIQMSCCAGHQANGGGPHAAEITPKACSRHLHYRRRAHGRPSDRLPF